MIVILIVWTCSVPPSELGVVMGETYSDRGTFVAAVLLVIVHQNFDPYTLYADIALLRIFEDWNYRSYYKVLSTFIILAYNIN